MPVDSKRLETLLQMRDDVLAELSVADREFSDVRMRVERMESDLRIGRPEPADFAHARGHQLPEAERRVLGLFRQLLKLEDQINLLP